MSRSRSEPSSRAQDPTRNGVTLAELVVVLALIGLIGSTIGLTLIRQQRFYRGTTELLNAREGVRDAMELLSTDIRGMSVADTVRLLADSAIEFFANVGSSVVCQNTGGTGVGLPSASSGRGNTLTALLTQPDTGDIAVFHRDSLDGASEWERHRIVGFGARSLATTCPASSGFTREAEIDAGATGFLLDLSTPLSSHVRAGAPVRFIRRGRYSLYHASDGLWHLGYRRCNAVGASGCGAIQPLSGPYRDYSSNPRNTGLLFEYLDGLGGPLTPGASPLAVARVDITARTESRQRILVEGRVITPSDSATVAIGIRNRLP
ncbi:MAG: type II secretion system GspH family protein [Gemmatimonadota bacterium]|nr:type II secretion system GspH family protein [Gemmatimonadota bacterium]